MTNETGAPQVRYEVGGTPFDFENKGNLVNRMVRRTLLKQGEIMIKKFGHLVHPDTGERPTLVVSMPNPSKPSVERRLDTDSDVMREWLVAKGFVKEQRTKKAVSEAAGDTSASAASASAEGEQAVS